MLNRAIWVALATGILNLPTGDTLAADGYTAQVNYTLHCQGCHLADGSGTPDKVPALKNQVGRFLHVDGGREYLVQVPGTSHSPMSDTEVAEVLNWMLETFSADQLPSDFVPYTREEVSRVRPEPLANVGAVRQGLVAALE